MTNSNVVFSSQIWSKDNRADDITWSLICKNLLVEWLWNLKCFEKELIRVSICRLIFITSSLILLLKAFSAFRKRFTSTQFLGAWGSASIRRHNSKYFGNVAHYYFGEYGGNKKLISCVSSEYCSDQRCVYEIPRWSSRNFGNVLS